MTKTELIKKWQSDLQTYCSEDVYTLNQLEVLFGCLCGVMSSELFEGGEVSLPGMGKLSAVHTKARDGRNPKTGEKLHIPARLRVTFKPSKAFMELLN